jgi:hypothetical protein
VGEMKKIFSLAWAALLMPAILCAQAKIEAPAWNLGDKWVFTGEGTIEVVNADQNSYALKFSYGIFIYETQGYNTIIFGKPSLNRIHYLDGEKRKKYRMGLSKILDFPFSTGKQWKYGFSSSALFGPLKGQHSYDYSEIFTVVGREDIVVQAGKFSAIKMEYKRITTGSTAWGGGSVGMEIKHHYWFSPDAKYFVKCQYDKDWVQGFKEVFNWELTSFHLKK